MKIRMRLFCVLLVTISKTKHVNDNMSQIHVYTYIVRHVQ